MQMPLSRPYLPLTPAYMNLKQQLIQTLFVFFLFLNIPDFVQAQVPDDSSNNKHVGTGYEYKKAGDRELKLYIVNPPNWKLTDKRPAIVWFHGGGWVKGGPNQFSNQSKYLAERGLICIQVEYRLLPQKVKEPPLMCVQDAKSAMRWVRSHASELGIDPERIAAGGGSAGGHLAAVCGVIDGLDDPNDDLTISAKPQAMLLFNPVLDTGPKTAWGRNLMGDRAEEFSPAHQVKSKAPPAIILLGTADKLIPVATAEKFKAAMEKVGSRCEAIYYEGQGHGFFNENQNGPKYAYETLLESDKFLQSLGWLTGPPTLKKPDETKDPVTQAK